MGWLGGFWWSVFCRFCLGTAWVGYRSSSLAILQLVVPDRCRGRVLAAYNFALILAMVLSFVGRGALPDVIGAPPDRPRLRPLVPGGSYPSPSWPLGLTTSPLQNSL
ncbi:MAG: hypothetical protein QME93_07015 [Bacillota bacterium]|nr:hypothetical protein [Bacillota bacterium]MDI7249801.1 hypothetical protein [Bacillota bacterium]